MAGRTSPLSPYKGVPPPPECYVVNFSNCNLFPTKEKLGVLVRTYFNVYVRVAEFF